MKIQLYMTKILRGATISVRHSTLLTHLFDLSMHFLHRHKFHYGIKRQTDLAVLMSKACHWVNMYFFYMLIFLRLIYHATLGQMPMLGDKSLTFSFHLSIFPAQIVGKNRNLISSRTISHDKQTIKLM